MSETGTYRVQAVKEERLFGMQILIVDDEPDLCNLLAAGLRAFFRCQVTTALTAEEALRDLEHSSVQPHVLISDVQLPGMNGVMFAREFANLHPEARIILTSGDIAGALASDLRPPSNILYLEKPFGLRELAGVIRGIMPKVRTA